MNRKIRVVVVDDHTVIRAGICAYLNLCGKIEVVGEASNGQEALSLLGRLPCDVVVVDLSMPGLGGLEFLKCLKKERSAVRAVVLSMYQSEEYIYQVIKAGASGFVSKDAPASELVAAIEAAFANRTYFKDELCRRVVDHLAVGLSSKTGGSLTPRELDVLRLVAEGRSNREIAEALCISVKTVEVHKARLMQKMGTKNYADLVKLAIKKGLIDPWSPVG